MYTVDRIAREIGGRVIGDGGRAVDSISPIESPREGSVVFVKKRESYPLVEGLSARLCVVAGFEPGPHRSFDFVVVDPGGVDLAFIKLLALFERKKGFPEGISPRAWVSPRAAVGAGVRIGDFASVGEGSSIGEGTRIGSHVTVGADCVVGKGCTIHPNVTIHPDTIIGDGVIIHAGAVIGADGFGYSNIGGVNTKIPQVGRVRIERNVEIGANATVDRATIGETVIGENTKIDNLVQIAHNVVIGKNSIVCGLCGVSGSVKIGDNVVLAGAVGIADHVVLEDGVVIAAKSGVMDRRVEKGKKLLGTPAVNFKAEMEFIALKPKLKAMYFDLKKIKEKLGM